MSPTKDKPNKQEHQGLRTNVTEQEATSLMNLALMDPPRWGWTAVGGISDLLPPHERARRKMTRVAFREQKQRFQISATNSVTPPPQQQTASVDSMMRQSHSRMMMDPSVPRIPPPSETPTDTTIFTTTNDSSLLGLGEKCAPTEPISETYSQSQTLFSGVNDKTNNPTTTGPQHDHLLKQRTTNTDPGLSTLRLGIPVQCLGITLAEKTKWPPPEKDATNNGDNSDVMTESINNNRATKQQINNELKVTSMSDGVLDMYAYHRGREGMEPRDPDTGQLICDVKPTDTMHNWDVPKKMMATITICFSLDGFGSVNNGMGSTNVPQYRDTIQWDLSDINTPAPMTYAASIAEEFGLSSGQTLDLAISIQKQLDAHVAQQKSVYVDPFTLKDPSGNERRISGPPRLTHRYGAVMDTTTEPGGMPLSRKEILQRQRKVPNASRRNSAGGSNGSSRRRGNVRPPPERQTVVVVRPTEEEVKVEEEYRKEVLKRARAASMLDCVDKFDEGMGGILKRQKDHHCHICHKRCAETFLFPCGNISHSFCLKHCKDRLGMTMEPGQPPKLEYCPVCCIECSCSQCSRKLDYVARTLKGECDEHGKSVEDVALEDILLKCSVKVPSRTQRMVVTTVTEQSEPVEPENPLADSVGEQLPAPKNFRRGRGGERKRPLVPKPPPTEFPQEVYGVRDVEAGTPTDYKTIFTADGNYVCESLPDLSSEQYTSSVVAVSSDAEVAEDGNVDYCHVCTKHGNLICCDFCPRAFHSKCIEGEVQSSGAKWECFVCRKEKREAEGDLVDGKDSLDLICASFFEASIGSDAPEKLQVLSMIHEMVQKLIAYDFGPMFAFPVEPLAVPGYKDVVKNPMDLGTIGEKLIHGGYINLLKDRQSWDDVIAAVLKDIELVWHNCFTFNYEDSSIYRMATVHRRKAQSIRERSFDHLLSDRVKAEVESYVVSCEQARGCYSSTSGFIKRSGPGSRPANRTNGKQTIKVNMEKKKVARAVAILDPSSSRIVKIYSSMKSTCQAAQILAALGLNCEWATINESNVKGIVHKSAADPSILLFGYRWLPLDELRCGKVIFSKASLEVLEMKHKSSIHLFLSIDEALSFPALPKSISLEKLRKELSSLPHGDAWCEIGRRSWRRPRIRSAGADENESPEEKDESSGPPGLHDHDYLNDSFMLKHSVLAKEDLVSGRKLIGFESIEAAFEDWVCTCECSPSFPDDEKISVERFQIFYLDGDRNVDGVVWRTLKNLSQEDVLNNVENSRENANGKMAGNEDPRADPASVQCQEQNKPLENKAGGMDSLPRVEDLDPPLSGDIGCDLSNGDDSSYIGKRKRVSLDSERSVKHFSSGEHKNSYNNPLEVPTRKNGTLLTNGQFSAGLIRDHESGDEVRRGADTAPNYVTLNRAL